jgi:hypothetical protein
MHRLPPQVPNLAGVGLNYSWFADAQLAATRWSAHLDSRVLLRAVFPVVVVALTVFGVGAVALHISGRPLAAAVAPALMVAGGFNLTGLHYERAFLQPYMTPSLVVSPAETYGSLMALPAIMLVCDLLRPRRRQVKLTWVTAALALLALSGSAAWYLPVFLCGAVGAWLVHLLVNRRASAGVSRLVGLLAFIVVFALLLHLGLRFPGLTFDPLGTVRAALRGEQIAGTAGPLAAMTLTMLVGWLLYGVGVVALARHGRWRDPRVLWMAMSVVAGTGAALLVTGPDYSQLWFQRFTATLVVLLSAWGVSTLLPDPLSRRSGAQLLGLAAAAGVGAFAATGLLQRAGNGGAGHATYPELLSTAAAPLVALVVFLVLRLRLRRPDSQPGFAVLLSFLLGLGLMHVFSLGYDVVSGYRVHARKPPPMYASGGFPAAKYVAQHAAPYDVVATNVHCALPRAPRCDNRSFWVSAYTQRRIVIEGWGDSAPTAADVQRVSAGRFLPSPYPRRLRLNNAAFQHPTAANLERLVTAYDVRWLFVDRQYPADVARLSAQTGLLTDVYRNPNYVVYKVNG